MQRLRARRSFARTDLMTLLAFLNRILRRAWPFCIGAAIAAVAYFQARGVSSLAASALYEPPPLPRSAPVLPARAERPDADPILERNPFDSETGPLDGSAPVDLPASQPPASPADPMAVPKCKFGALSLTILRDDPKQSFAAIIGPKGQTELRYVGDSMAEHQLSRVGWDRVWFRNGSTRCQMELGDDTHVKKKRRTTRRPKRRRRSRRSSRLPKRIADKIERLGPNEIQVERSVVDEILENQAQWMRRTRIRPVKRGDDVVGLRVSRVRRGSLLAELGMKNGDVLKSINGFDITDPQKALQAYAKLRRADRLTVEIERRGKPVSIDINIQ